MSDFMTALYAAVTAIEEGKIAEAVVDERIIGPDGTERVLSVEARREVRHFDACDGDAG